MFSFIGIGTPKGVGPVKVGENMKAGIKFGGVEIDEGKIDVDVAERSGPYIFKET